MGARAGGEAGAGMVVGGGGGPGSMGSKCGRRRGGKRGSEYEVSQVWWVGTHGAGVCVSVGYDGKGRRKRGTERRRGKGIWWCTPRVRRIWRQGRVERRKR